MNQQEYLELIEAYKDFVWGKLNRGREDNAFLWLPKSRHTFKNASFKDAHLEVARQRLLLQGFIGIVDELAELEEEKVAVYESEEDFINELGDVFFYASLLDITYDFNILKVIFGEDIPTISGTREDIIENAKKYIFQERVELKEILENTTQELLYDQCKWFIECYPEYYEDWPSFIEGVVIKNMKKLNKRYKNGYTVEESLNRKVL